MKRLIQNLLFIVITCFFAFSGIGQLYSFKKFDHKNGLQLNAVLSIFPQQDGSLLLGTNGAGIIEFDGYSFKEYVRETQRENLFVSDIVSVDNTIYFISKYSGLYKVNQNKEIKSLYLNSAYGDYFKMIAKKNELFILTSKGILIWNIQTNKQQFFSIRTTNESLVNQLVVAFDELLLVRQTGISIFKNGKEQSIESFFNRGDLSGFNVASFHSNSLFLYDSSLKNELVIKQVKDQYQFSTKPIHQPASFKRFPSEINEVTYNPIKKSTLFSNKNGDLYDYVDGKLIEASKNYDNTNLKLNSVTCDFAGFYWLASNLEGIFKIGVRPFTKIELNTAYEGGNISFVFKTKQQKLLFSSATTNKLYIGSLTSNAVKDIDLTVYSATYLGEKLLLGTKNGVYLFNETNETVQKINLPNLKDQSTVRYLSYHEPFLWLSTDDPSLYQYTQDLKLVHTYTNEKIGGTVYTGQPAIKGDELLIGTSTGVKKITLKNHTVTKLSHDSLGFYSGLSTIDAFDTRWFTLDKGIIGFTKQGKTIVLNAPSIFSTYLFYTLNSDKHGKLFIGTNKGINAIQLNEKGEVLSQNNYSSKTGFEGYETNMRASFQTTTQLFLGTIEGMYIVDYEVLNDLIPTIAPSIQQLRVSKDKEGKEFQFVFVDKNPLLRNVIYQYRYKQNIETEWSKSTSSNRLTIKNLPNGEYTLEVRSSYNGSVFGPVASYSFTVKRAFYTEYLWLIAIVSIIVLLLIYKAFKSKYDTVNQGFYYEETAHYSKSLPSLILFVAIAKPVTHVAIYYMGIDVKINVVLEILISGVFFAFYFIASKQSKLKNHASVNRIIIVSYIVLIAYFLYGLYVNSLHPFYGYPVVLSLAVSPFIFFKTKHVMMFSFMIIVLSALLTYFSEDTHYDKYLLLFMLVSSVVLSLFISVARHENFRQLSLISSIINKSNVVAIAMNSKSVIKYVSRNIGEYIELNASDLVNQSINEINRFIPETEATHAMNLKDEFFDGKRFTSPFRNEKGEVFWFDWVCKYYENDLFVLIGQEVSDKISFTNMFYSIFKESKDVIYKTKLSGEIEFVNHWFFDEGKPADSYIGQYMVNWVEKSVIKEASLFYAKQINERIPRTYFEMKVVHPDGRSMWIRQSAFLVFDLVEKDKPSGLMVIAKDITEEVENKKEIFQLKRSVDSYSKAVENVQQLSLLNQEPLRQYFDECFVLKMPKKNNLSDFYWSTEIDGNLMIIVGETKGTDLQNAMISLYLNGLLYSTINEKTIQDPSVILQKIDTKLTKTIENNPDNYAFLAGIEMTVCCINIEEKSFKYASAGGRLVTHDGNELIIRKGDSKRIGVERANFDTYVMHYFPLSKYFTMYLFTDGYIEQIGDRNMKRYSIKRFIELIDKNIRLPLSAQHDIFENEFIHWKGGVEQTDDVTVLGVRIES